MELQEESKVSGLELNYEKTNLLTNGEKIKIEMNGKTLYTGWKMLHIFRRKIISFTDTIEKGVNHRIASGWKKFWAFYRRYLDEILIAHKKSTDLQHMRPSCHDIRCAKTWSLTFGQSRKILIESYGKENYYRDNKDGQSRQ